jgi:hypothetical protein
MHLIAPLSEIELWSFISQAELSRPDAGVTDSLTFGSVGGNKCSGTLCGAGVHISQQKQAMSFLSYAAIPTRSLCHAFHIIFPK